MRRPVVGHLVVWFTLTACAALLAGRAAQPAAAQTVEPGSELTVYLATYHPGSQVWEKFGHNAIWIRDSSTGTTISYNYGMFSFDQPAFVPRLMKGRMLYAMDVRAAADEVYAYQYFDRSIVTQRLNLAASQKHALREFLEANWAQDSGRYLYDYFRDNCSTRIRDALDAALGGQIRASLQARPTASTYRSESLRLTARSAATYTGLLIGLGMPTDRPLSAWEESFIPMRLQDHLRTVQVTMDGRTVPLVAEEVAVFTSSQTPPPDAPPRRTAAYLITGLLLAAGVIGLGRLARARRDARLALAVTLSVWCAATGFLGLILLLLWLFTDHSAAYPNLNLLQLNPLALVLAVAAPLALGPGRAHGQEPGIGRFGGFGRVGWPLALLLAGLSLTGLLILLVPALHQSNGPLIALLLPVHAAVAWCLYPAGGFYSSPPEDVSGRISLREAA